MRFLRGALYNYFPIAGTETLNGHFLQPLAYFTIISPLRGLKLNIFNRMYVIIFDYSLYNYFPIAGTETIRWRRLVEKIKLYNYFPIAGTETLAIGHYGSAVPLQLFPHCGD